MTRKLTCPRLPVKVLSALFALVAFAATATTAFAAGSTSLVISQVFGGGGNTNAVVSNDYVEILNIGTTAIDMSQYSVQYSSSTGTSIGSNFTVLTGTLQPKHYYLVQEGGGANTPAALPTPDATGTLALSGTAGKVFLAKTTTALAGTTAATLCGDSSIVDLVDFGGATVGNCAEGSTPGTNTTGGPLLSNTLYAQRAGAGCTDTNNNASDFTAVTLTTTSMHNSASTAATCSSAPVTTIPTGIGSASPTSVLQGSSTVLTVVVTPGTNPTSTGIGVTLDLTAFGGTSTTAMTLSSTANTYTYTLNVPSNQPVNSADTINATINDDQHDTTQAVPITFAVTSPNSTSTATPTASPVAPTPSQSTTLTTVVTGVTTPTGSVTFKEGSTTLGSGTLTTATSTTATASFTVTGGFTAGPHSITAVYVPTGIYTTSTSTALTLQVNAVTFGSGIVISQMYGGGGNSMAPVNADYLELFNDSATPQTMTGWSVQYASAAGASVTAASGVWDLPTVTIPAGGYYLVGGATGATGAAPTLAFDTVPLNTAATPIGFGFSGTAGKVYLVNSTAALGSTAIPLAASVVDAITYGTGLTNQQGASAAPTVSNTTLDVRNNPCVDTNNGSDFSALPVTVGTAHNSTSPVAPCGPLPVQASNPTATPSTVRIGSHTLLTVTVTPGTNPVSTGIGVTADLSAFGFGTAVAFNDAGTGGDVTPGDGIYSYTLAVPSNQPINSYNVLLTVTDTQHDSIHATISLSTAALSSTNLALTTNPTPPISNVSTQLIATVTPNSGDIVGTVIFNDAGVQIGDTAPPVNSNGVAVLTLPNGLSTGVHTLSAVYSGDSNYATSTGSLLVAANPVPTPDFMFALSNAQVITSGQDRQVSISVYATAVDGFSASIRLSCSGLPAQTNCNFSPQTITPNPSVNGGVVMSTLTFVTESSANRKPVLGGRATGIALGFTLLAVPFAFRRRRSVLKLVVILAILLIGIQGLTGCGSGGTPVGSSTVTITATASTGQIHSSTIVLTNE